MKHTREVVTRSYDLRTTVLAESHRPLAGLRESEYVAACAGLIGQELTSVEAFSTHQICSLDGQGVNVLTLREEKLHILGAAVSIQEHRRGVVAYT